MHLMGIKYNYASQYQDSSTGPIIALTASVVGSIGYYFWRNRVYNQGYQAVQASAQERIAVTQNPLIAPARTLCATDLPAVSDPSPSAPPACSAEREHQAYPSVVPSEQSYYGYNSTAIATFNQRDLGILNAYRPSYDSHTKSVKNPIIEADTQLDSNAQALTRHSTNIQEQQNFWRTSWFLPFKSARWVQLDAHTQEKCAASTQAQVLKNVRVRLNPHISLVNVVASIMQHFNKIEHARPISSDSAALAHELRGTQPYSHFYAANDLTRMRDDLDTCIQNAQQPSYWRSLLQRKFHIDNAIQLRDIAATAATCITKAPQYDIDQQRKIAQDNQDRELIIKEQHAIAQARHAEAAQRNADANAAQAAAAQQTAHQQERETDIIVYGRNYVQAKETWGPFIAWLLHG